MRERDKESCKYHTFSQIPVGLREQSACRHLSAADDSSQVEAVSFACCQIATQVTSWQLLKEQELRSVSYGFPLSKQSATMARRNRLFRGRNFRADPRWAVIRLDRLGLDRGKSLVSHGKSPGRQKKAKVGAIQGQRYKLSEKGKLKPLLKQERVSASPKDTQRQTLCSQIRGFKGYGL